MRIPDDIYEKIVRAMPIPCVDLIVSNQAGEILLVCRTNEPARGQWWFPGGRVYFGETRKEAVGRHLLEECGLHATSPKELWTCDVILPLAANDCASHAITTLYTMKVKEHDKVTLDSQGSEFAWKKPSTWQRESLHPLMAEFLSKLQKLSLPQEG